jgi:hypothetical protein
MYLEGAQFENIWSLIILTQDFVVSSLHTVEGQLVPSDMPLLSSSSYVNNVLTSSGAMHVL